MGREKRPEGGVGKSFYASYTLAHGLFSSLTLSVYHPPLHVYPMHEKGHLTEGLKCPCRPSIQIQEGADAILIVHCLMGASGDKVE